MSTNREIEKRSPKIKSTVIQYIIVGVVAFPFLAWFALATSGKISDALMIFIMCIMMLAFWLAFVGIRHLYRKRADRIIKAKQTLRNSKTSYKRSKTSESSEVLKSEAEEASNVTIMKTKNTKGNK